jgi:hypothetical protein
MTAWEVKGMVRLVLFKLDEGRGDKLDLMICFILVCYIPTNMHVLSPTNNYYIRYELARPFQMVS